MTRSELRRCGPLPSLVLSFALAGCGGDNATPTNTTPAADKATPQDQLARELAAAQFNRANPSLTETRKALAPLVERKDASQRDLVHAAVVEIELADVDRARAFLERAAKLGAGDAALNYNLGRLAELEGDIADAATHFRKALDAAPNDTPTKLHLVNAIEESDPKEAERLLRDVLSHGIENEGAWYASAMIKLGNLLRMDSARTAEAMDVLVQFRELDVKVPGNEDFKYGNLGRVTWPGPQGVKPAADGHPPVFGDAKPIAPQLAGAAHVRACDLDNDGDLDLIAYGPKGLFVALQDETGGWSDRKLADGPVTVAIDLAFPNDPVNKVPSDDSVDIVYASGAKLTHLRMSRAADGALEWAPLPAPELPSAPAAGLAVDFDHEGDLDLLFVGPFGARLLRNDGAGKTDGRFTDVTESSGLPTSGAYEWCSIEDLDTDQDVDLILGGPRGLFIASNLRGGKLESKNEWMKDVPASSLAPAIADFDGDARPDAWLAAGEQPAFFRGRVGGSMVALGDKGSPAVGLSDALQLWCVDLDLNGAADVVWSSPGALNARYDVGLPSERDGRIDLAPGAGAALVEDLDGDLAWDVLAITDSGATLQRGAQPGSHAVRLAFRGKKDNRRGIGAIVELRAAQIYRRIFWRGEATLLGVGDETATDIVRVLWPNGVHQYELRRDLGDRAATGDSKLGALEQPDGLVGSCPFLYTWNGHEYEFISDVLGITPLGLPMAPGMLVPPDHDEYVLVRGEQLAPKDGAFELQFTEELREVTYLDRVRLDVVDSPVDVELYPNELFTFPPFPEPHNHTVRGALAPRKATGSDGGDWTAALARIDDEYAAPFDNAPSQFLGLATPHWLELEFDPAAVREAKKLRLVATGWFYWTDASVNMASAYDPEQEFVPPLIQVQGEDGEWRPAAPPIGFPAGKTKTMVVDVTGLFPRESARIRLFSTLRLYWDSLRLAIDADDAPTRTHSLEPSSALLWRRGFSRPLPPRSNREPERFDWNVLSERPRWNQHPGLYTRFGDCLELVTEIDDRMVIMGSSDALTLRFDATSLPPLEQGWRRDYLVFLDGWAKDRDPNTIDALYVEPLPFHGMSGYPYRADEHFPDDQAHRDWRSEWNTRPGIDFIERLSTKP